MPKRFSAAVTEALARLRRLRAARSEGASPGASGSEASAHSEGASRQQASEKLREMVEKARRNPSVTLRAGLACGCAVVLFTLAAGGLFFAEVYEEARDAQDDRLEEVAGMLARTRAAFSPRHHGSPAFEALFMNDDDFEEKYLLPEGDPRAGLPANTDVLINTLHRNGRALPARFGEFLPDGFHTLRLHRREYRLLLVTLRDGYTVIVAERTSEAFKLAADNTLSMLMPLGLLAVFLSFGIAILVWRSMRPVRRLAQDVGSRSGETLAPVSEAGMPSEVLPLLSAFNGLLSRVSALRDQEARFVADAAHELRSPLTALSLQAEALEKTDLSPEARKQVEVLRTGIDRAVRQVSQLLALKRAQAAPAETASGQRASIAQAVGEAVESVYWEAEKLGITIEAAGFEDLLDGADPAFAMKPDDLFTILRNLLENAVRYSPRGGAVTVRLDSAEPPVLTVADQGHGIPAEERARVLEPFYRRLGTGVSGTGLGLAIVKTLCGRWNLELQLSDADPENAEAPGLAVTLREKAHPAT